MLTSLKRPCFINGLPPLKPKAPNIPETKIKVHSANLRLIMSLSESLERYGVDEHDYDLCLQLAQEEYWRVE